MEADVEYLAGIVDLAQVFKAVELSPRWMVAGKKDVNITVAYPASGNQVNYHYIWNESNNSIKMTVSGNPDSYLVRLLLPSGKYRQ